MYQSNNNPVEIKGVVGNVQLVFTSEQGAPLVSKTGSPYAKAIITVNTDTGIVQVTEFFNPKWKPKFTPEKSINQPFNEQCNANKFGYTLIKDKKVAVMREMQQFVKEVSVKLDIDASKYPNLVPPTPQQPQPQVNPQQPQAVTPVYSPNNTFNQQQPATSTGADAFGNKNVGNENLSVDDLKGW